MSSNRKRARSDSSSDESEKAIEEQLAKKEENCADDAAEIEAEKSFQELGINEELCDACSRLGWTSPTPIQQKCLAIARENRDIIALAETGSGKTGAFALPILQALMDTPQKLFALVLTPTRELAFQISEQFEALGASIGLTVSTIVGGIDMTAQALSLAKRPHVIVATPGRLADHLENTRGFNLRTVKYLVMDEADRLLSSDFELEFEKILRTIPKNRRTYLFSATMTKKVSKLERACLKDPVKVELSTKYQTVGSLIQNFIFIPQKYKEAYLVYVLNEKAGNSAIVFCSTCAGAVKTALTLRNLGVGAVSLHGQMSQPTRLGALNKFKKKDRPVLVCTDVASRGLDIPCVDMVINFDVPNFSKDYIHRVGRTARAGRSGVSLTFVTQYDVELYQKVEQSIGKKLTAYPINTNDVMQIVERVGEAARKAAHRYKELEEGKKRKKEDIDDAGEAEGKQRRFDDACVRKKKFRRTH